MTLFDPVEAAGHQMTLRRTNDNHMAGRREAIPSPVERTSFGDALFGSLEEVNRHQVSHEELSIQAVLNPESVEAHDLTIAAAQAQTSLSITRNIVDRVIQAYRDITNLR